MLLQDSRIAGLLGGADHRRRNIDQKETGRDTERLSETTPRGGDAIFAPLNLPYK